MSGSSSIIISILPSDAAAAAHELEAIPPGPDPIELRADRLSAQDVAALVAGTEREFIVAVRRKVDGGSYEGDERARRATLQAALDAGARWIDVEWGGELAAMADGPYADRVILSDHGAPCERDTLEQRVERMSRSLAARLKIVARADRPSQIVVIRDLLRDHPDERLCAFALGTAGALSRLLAPVWGSWGTYAAARPGAATAPGQFTAEELRNLFNVLSIRESTRIVALAGNDVFPVSPSPAMHNAGYRALDLDRVYLPFQAEDWSEVVAVSEALGFAGLAVTMPFKGEAAGYVARSDELSGVARAVNTIVFEAAGPVGANTDGSAAVDGLEAHGLATGDRIDVLGAGGTGRAVAAALVLRGYHPRLWSRNAGPGLRAPARIEQRPLDGREHGDTDWLINATPLRDETLVGAGAPARKGVLDVVYGPRPTALVVNAKRAGLHVIDGLGLLAAQAEGQFELQTGRKPPPELFAAAGQRYLDGLG